VRRGKGSIHTVWNWHWAQAHCPTSQKHVNLSRHTATRRVSQQHFITARCTPETAMHAAMHPIMKTFDEEIIAGTLRLHTRLGWSVGV